MIVKIWQKEFFRTVLSLKAFYNVISNAETDLVFVCGADMPMVTGELVRYMVGYISSDYDCYCLTDEKHIQPLCAIYSKAVLQFDREALENGDFKFIHLLRHVRTKFIDLSFTTFDKKVIRNNNIRKPAKTWKTAGGFLCQRPEKYRKTGLIIRLINEFIREGYSVGTIKHDGHEYDMDHEGTDSFRFSQAGAKVRQFFPAAGFPSTAMDRQDRKKCWYFRRGLDVVIFKGLNFPLPKDRNGEARIAADGRSGNGDPYSLRYSQRQRNPRTVKKYRGWTGCHRGIFFYDKKNILTWSS